jgi:DNA polymerase
MPRHLHLDFETFSKIDIRDVGAYRYAFDPSTEILCAAMAFDDEEPVVWHAGLDEIELMEIEPYWAALRDHSVLIYAHNAMFESAICQALLTKTWGISAPALERFRCTMSLARRASLPAKLEKLAEVLKLGNQKDIRGKSLLKKFSMMQPAKKPTLKNPNGLPPRRILPTDEPEAFAELLAYCVQDVRAEQEVARKLAYFDEPINNRNYTLDQRINARGVPVNLQALRHAQKLIDEETAIVSQKFRELTGFEVTQGAVFLQWLHGKGAHLDNLQAETIEMYLDNQEFAKKQGRNVALLENDKLHLIELSKDPEPIYALRLKQSIAYASIKKVKTMLECAGPHDNRIRGMLNHHGATTGRWTASLVQFQNIKRAVYKYSETAYKDLCEEMSREMFEICHGAVLEVISSCVRHFVHDV